MNRCTNNPCTLCRGTGIPGLLRGVGKCQYHWVAGVWGKEYADQLVLAGSCPAPKKPKEEAVCSDSTDPS